MEVPRDSMLLRIFIGESDRWKHKPLYEAIVLKAREMHLGGATVLRGPMGFGKSSRMHTAKILRLSMDLPIVIEIVDTEDKINTLLPYLDEMMGGGLVTLEKVKVIHYRDQAQGKAEGT
jgi:PII-like signaling protein